MIFIARFIILGRVPMRRLVYRVQPLPQSMLPLVWDFGQLNTAVEELYIRQMVIRYVSLKWYFEKKKLSKCSVLNFYHEK